MNNITTFNLRLNSLPHKKHQHHKQKALTNNYKTIPTENFNLSSFIKNKPMKETKNLFYIKLDRIPKEANQE